MPSPSIPLPLARFSHPNVGVTTPTFAVALIVALSTVACVDFPRRPADASADGLPDARDGASDVPVDRRDDLGTGVPDAPGSESQPACSSGTHLCGATCVDSTSPESCGTSCTPCPPVEGGTATCVGAMCGGACPTGQKLCLGKCIPNANSCEGTCPTGSHNCQGVCASDSAVNSCGSTSCMPCPSPAGGMATCDGTRCDFTCQTGKKCSSGCGACCADADCPARSNQVASCDTATRECKYACPASSPKLCSGTCIASNACCADADCPAQAGQVGRCDSSTRTCTYNCSSTTKPCGNACIPSAGCCTDGDCGGSFACQSNACSTTVCRSGYKLCGGTCIPSNACCANADCPARSNQVATCDTATRACRYACPASSPKLCSETCIASNACCTDGDCPVQTGQVGRCDSSTRTCSYSCNSTTKPCGNACIPTAGCCSDSDCASNFACQSNTCSTTVCRTGYKPCGGRCIAQSACCQDGDCGMCKKCVSNSCQNQLDEDVKQECADMPASSCSTQGTCDGNGGCKLWGSGTVCQPQTCSGSSLTPARQCNGVGACSTASAQPCPGDHACDGNGCSATACRAGYKNCNGTCVPNSTCCADSDCGSCKKCVSGSCQNQGASEDLKNDCADTACKTGTCNGQGSCGVRTRGQVDGRCSGGCDQCDGSGACGAVAMCVPDVDRDGYGSNSGAAQSFCFSCPAGTNSQRGDCDDSATGGASVNPAAPFRNYPRPGGGWDWNCDGRVDYDMGMQTSCSPHPACNPEYTTSCNPTDMSCDNYCGVEFADTPRGCGGGLSCVFLYGGGSRTGACR